MASYPYSRNSKARLATCHPKLCLVFKTVSKYVDNTILEGRRGKAEQDRLHEIGKSEKEWPDSKHNVTGPEVGLSLAVDVAPCPIDWEDARRFYLFAGFVLGIARQLGIALRWGGDWDGDFKWRDQKFHDLVHFELADGEE